MRNSNQSDVFTIKNVSEQERKLRMLQWLSKYFYQRVIPLERRYILLLNRQIDLLNRYRLSPELTTEQLDELSDWISQLKRTIGSRAFIQQAERLYAKEETGLKAQFETNLWYLFGGSCRSDIKYNLDKFCRSYEPKIMRINAALADITSAADLKDYLKQRRNRETRTVGFLEESRRYCLR